MNVEIRKAQPEHYEQVKFVLDQSDSMHLEALPFLFKDPGTESWKKEYVINLIEDEKSDIFIALVGQKIVGVMVLIIKENLQLAILRQRSFVVLDNIAVLNEFQGRGIGSRLLENMEPWARDKKLDDIELNVYEFNTGAISLYEKLDFKTYSRRMVKTIIKND